MQVAVLHNDLATALDRCELYTEAESHVRQSLELAATLGSNQDVMEATVTFQYNLGLILLHQGMQVIVYWWYAFSSRLRVNPLTAEDTYIYIWPNPGFGRSRRFNL